MTTKSASTTATRKPRATSRTSRRAATPRRSATSRSSSSRSRPAHRDIAERAYFIHLEEGSGDEVANWLRAERELIAA